MRGVSFAILAAVLFGISTPLSKWLLADIPPQFLAGLLYLGSGVGLTLGNVLWGRPLSIPRADLGWLGLAILCGGILAPVMLLAGLQVTTASTASLMLNLEGVFTAGLAWLVFREGFDRKILAGMVLIVAGGLVLQVQGAAIVLGPGALWIGAACLGWALDNNFTQKVSAGDPLQIAALKGLVAGTVQLLAAWSSHQLHAPSFAPLVAAAGLGLVSYGFSLAAFVLALRHLGTARTGAYFSLAPFVGAALSLAIFREPVTLRLVGATLLMAGGVYLHLTEHHEHEHTHEEMEHEHFHEHDEHHRHGHDHLGPHTHHHRHERLTHTHPHYPDLHHRHEHGDH